MGVTLPHPESNSNRRKKYTFISNDLLGFRKKIPNYALRGARVKVPILKSSIIKTPRPAYISYQNTSRILLERMLGLHSFIKLLINNEEATVQSSLVHAIQQQHASINVHLQLKLDSLIKYKLT